MYAIQQTFKSYVLITPLLTRLKRLIYFLLRFGLDK